MFQLESNELAVEPLPGRTGDYAWSLLLMFEAAEGGAGVLRRLATEPDPLAPVARARHRDPALRPGHRRRPAAKPSTPPRTARQACYDCLLSYGNQWDHQALDRHCVIDLLQTARPRATLEVAAGGEDRARQLGPAGRRQSNELGKDSSCASSTHAATGCPTHAQETVDGYYVRPDFAYHTGGDVAIFIDGPVHDDRHTSARRTSAQARLEDEAAGWCCGSTTRRPHYSLRDQPIWQSDRTDPSVFGPARALMTATEFRTGTLVTARGREWLVLPGSPPRNLLVRPLGGTGRRDHRAAARARAAITRRHSTRPASTTAATPPGPGYCATRCACRSALRWPVPVVRAAVASSPRNYQLVPLMMAQPRTPRGC